MQRLLNTAAWDADDVRAYAVEHLGEPAGVLVVGETASLKSGHEIRWGATSILRNR